MGSDEAPDPDDHVKRIATAYESMVRDLLEKVENNYSASEKHLCSMQGGGLTWMTSGVQRNASTIAQLRRDLEGLTTTKAQSLWSSASVAKESFCKHLERRLNRIRKTFEGNMTRDDLPSHFRDTCLGDFDDERRDFMRFLKQGASPSGSRQGTGSIASKYCTATVADRRRKKFVIPWKDESKAAPCTVAQVTTVGRTTTRDAPTTPTAPTLTDDSRQVQSDTPKSRNLECGMPGIEWLGGNNAQSHSNGQMVTGSGTPIGTLSSRGGNSSVERRDSNLGDLEEGGSQDLTRQGRSLWGEMIELAASAAEKGRVALQTGAKMYDEFFPV